ncbi:asparagine synthase-related protein [Aliarcobacter skirrowii]|uniref:asparagine synthase-related protein n=1 Tax=Aliarcobacter skirrowii TaxID=28200 RepID=UPI0029AFF1EC|nr:asparagine synthase-related protein [Aliarcobacter skirrowii]MDX4063327.1 asparagine synthase-related protein [Aliarcobacter skirrowii]
MPGIYGYIKQLADEKQIDTMSKNLFYQNSFIQDDIFSNDYLECSHIHIGNMKKNNNYFFRDGVYISIEGEQYDFSDMSFEEFLFNAYINKSLEKQLNKLDGYFNVIIYDSNINKLFLISDRYGMRMLYYYFKNGRFAWSGEIKGLLSLDFIDKTVSQSSFNCFIDLGYLLEDNTWFEHIKLVNPASIIEFDINNKQFSQKYYWKWSQIKQQKISFEDSVDRLGKLFINAIKKRFTPNEKIGIALSGGLDSRAIFSAVNYLYPNYKGDIYTFGIKNCDDIEIAKLVAKKTMWKHKIFYFNETNWFVPRIDKIYYTDGMLNMMHMHGSEFLDEICSKIDFNLNGYAGDIVCGGGWFNKLELDKRADNNLKIFYDKYISMCKINEDFYNIEKSEPHLYMNRVRRFTNMGTVNGLYKIDQRKPFFDNDLIEFIFSIPDEYRKNNKLYSAMLLKKFPKFFKDIPWQKTRKNIDGRDSSYLKNENIIRNYMNYAGDIREKSILDKIFEILDYEKSYYKNFTNIDAVKVYLQPHLDSIQVNYIEKIFRFITAELYFRKINEKTK